MNDVTRRELLQRLATAGGVVLAQAVVAKAEVAKTDETTGSAPTPLERAERLADDLPAEDETEPVAFLNRAFRNGGGFRNGGFRNAGFHNAGFRNGGFRNAGFRNGAFRNGVFRNW